MYIISEREDGSFEIRKEGSKRASKIFSSKIEAINYCEKRKYEYKIGINIGSTKVNINNKALKKHWKGILVFVVVIILLFGLVFALDYYKVINIGFADKIIGGITNINKDDEDKKPNNNQAVVGTTYDDFQIHFLMLGNDYTGDSIYIKAGETDILIDAGSRKDSADDIISYLDNYVTDDKLEYVIATHGDQDHIAGFVGNKSGNSYTGVLYNYEIDNLIMNDRTSKSSSIYENFLEAVDYLSNNGTKVMYADDCFNNTNGAEDSFILDEESNITMDILYNYYYFNDTSGTDENNYSVCTMFNYNDHHYLLTGDLEEEGEEHMALYYDGSTPEKTLPHVDLFKAGHHGSKTSSNDCLLKLITPDIVTVCCCAGSTEYTANYQNIFPTQEFINRVAKYTDQVYVTSYFDEKELKMKPLNGNIIVSSNGIDTAVSASNNTTKLKDSEWFNETVYVLNDLYISSGKGKIDFYTANTPNSKPVVRRTWPNY